MFNTNSTKDHPFWIDDPNPYSLPGVSTGSLLNSSSKLNSVLSIFWQIVVILLAISLAFQYPWLWLLVAYLGVTRLLLFLFFRKNQLTIRRSAEIQQLAKEKSGALTIGSAIHSAGHPYLQINQPVVLALTGDSLAIYSYQNAIPLDTILLKDIQSLELVTYDDDGIAHTGVVNSTAQALQIRFTLRGQICTCLFRRLYKVRAVGWYQELQAARLAQTSAAASPP